MEVNGLPLPRLLVEAIEAGRWPRTAEEAVTQDHQCWVPEERIRLLAPEESRLYLYHPPFATVASVLAQPKELFYCRFGAPEQLVPEAAVEIGDFGMGSDAPILLDYRTSRENPRIIRLRWSEGGRSNTWVVMASDFEAFSTALGL